MMCQRIGFGRRLIGDAGTPTESVIPFRSVLHNETVNLTSVERFIEWGGAPWLRQVQHGLAWIGDVSSLRVLELGTRRGRMATWFGLQGATVLGLDVDEAPLVDARRFAAANGVGERVTFGTHSGDPRELPTGFDLIFSKSVVVLMDVEVAAAGMARALNPLGRILLVENARGPLPVHLLRMVRRRSVRPHGANYFTPDSVDIVRRYFDVDLVRWSPTVVVIGATRHG